MERRQRQRAELQAQRQRGELAHASRLAAVGEITASIAHQINQPLGAILSNTDAAEMLLEASPLQVGELRQILADIRRDDERASDVIRGMRALLQRRELEVRPMDLNQAISEVLHLLAGEARRRGVALETDLAPELPAVAGDRVHLQQVILNLVLNGLEAAGHASERERRLSVRSARGADGEVEVAVQDTGPGIDLDRLPRLFDSFFTTKPDGLGLGLSVARSLVEAHGGRIWAETSGAGATFRFALPLDARSSRDARRPPGKAAASAEHSSERIP